METSDIKQETIETVNAVQKFIDNYGGKILTAAIVAIVGSILVSLIVKFAAKFLKRSRIDVTVHKFMLSVIKIILYLLLGLVVLQIFGVPTASLVAALGVVGLAVSLAVKDSLANVAGGIIILMSKPFEVGDYVKINDAEGTVIHINVINTKLDTVDNKAIYIPNGQVSSEKIVNFTREPRRRLDLIFSIGYKDDFKLAQLLITQIITAHPMALNDPAPAVRMCEHGVTMIKIVSKVWVKSEDYWDLNYDLLERVKLKFDECHINMQAPQMLKPE